MRGYKRQRRAVSAAGDTRDGGSAFYREGEYWTIEYAGTICRLRDTKGLHCLAHLLSHPE